MATIAEQQLALLRAAAARAASHPQVPNDVRDAISILVTVIGELHLQVDWLRRDLAGLAAPAAASPPTH